MYLNCHTGFSFKYGTLPVEELFNEVKRCGVKKLILTEINNTASYMEMLRIRDTNKTQPHGLTKFEKEPYDFDIGVGIEFRRENELLYIALAKNNEGFETLNRHLSFHNREEKPFPTRMPAFENIFVVYPFGKLDPEQLLGHEYIGVKKQELHLFAALPSRQEYPAKFLALHPVTFLPPHRNEKGKWTYRDFNAHRLLRCIANNTLLSKLPEHHQASKEEFMLPESTLEKVFSAFPELIQNTKQIVDQCSIECELGVDKNKKSIKGSKEKDLNYLKEETIKGYERIYAASDHDKNIWARIENELRIINTKNFASYYLITYDLINETKRKGFDFVGRGSGANSTVAYCLGITNVDPIELDLYFERFLNEERTSPPDFDIDFSWDNRDEIYEYLFQKYEGNEHVCLLGTHVTYKSNSIIRELGKVFGLPKDEIDDLVENKKNPVERDHIARKVMAYAQYIVNKELPANFSIHAGGVLITEKSIYAYTATDTPPKGLPVSHFEMHNAEDFGIYKFDILSQRGLGHIKETVKHVRRNKGIDVDVHLFNDFKKDKKVKDLMRQSKAMGCFYVESPAMRMLLEKLRCDDYLTLVAASSIIRPGVASSGMMRAYIERYHAHHDGKAYEVTHDMMQQLMPDTFGVMVYQEDVIKVANKFARLTLTEADVFRRGMSGKYRSREEFQRVQDKFFENCKNIGYEQKVIDQVWKEIESFAGYSFAKGHSASYAVESYQSLYLKAHYPLEFMVGVINNFGGFYKTEFYFHEARMNGARIEAPCINYSNHLTTIYETRIYIGFIHLKSLETKIAQRIPWERAENGPYKSFDNFLRRIPEIGLEQLRILIRIGAFRFTNKNKQQLLWEAMLYFSSVKMKPTTTVDLFDTEPKNYLLPVLQRDPQEDGFDEMELLGFPLCDPFDLLPSKDYGDTNAKGLKNKLHQQVRIVGYVVTTKETRTRKNEHMCFGTFYDCNGAFFDTVHFPDSALRFPFRGRGFYEMKGKVTEDFGVYTIEVSCMNKLSMVHRRPEQVLQEFT
jgi:DNA-directed DNA polymerase III PolC